MIPFLVIAGVLIVVVIAGLSYRLWRTPTGIAVDDSVDALGVLRDQRRELDAEVEAGRMTPEERETRLLELTRRVHDEGLSSASAVPAGPALRTRRVWLAAIIALLVPVVALYEVHKVLSRKVSTKVVEKFLDVMRLGRVLDITDARAIAASRVANAHGLAMADAMMYSMAQEFNAAFWTQDVDYADLADVNFFAKQ